MSYGNFGCHESLRWLFGSPESVYSYPYGSGRKFEVRHEVALLSLENYRRRFVFIPKLLEDLFLTIILISRYQNVNNTISEIVVKLLENLRIF